MHRNPLLYSDSSEIPRPEAPPQKEAPRKSSLLFYFIILANSLLVLFVLGFIWFLFLKSPDLQLKEISNRFFGSDRSTEVVKETIVAPEIQTEIILTPNQQEKDETQQARLKQMREKEALAEKARLESIKAELENQKILANEAKQAIEDLQTQEGIKNVATQNANGNTIKVPVEAEQVPANDLPVESSQEPKMTNSESLPTNSDNKPAAPTTSSQVDLIMEALKNQ